MICINDYAFEKCDRLTIHTPVGSYAEQYMYNRLIEEMAERQGVTETLKAEQPMEWIGLMNNIQACAREVVNNELIYA